MSNFQTRIGQIFVGVIKLDIMVVLQTEPKWFAYEERIRLGAFYTPFCIVSKVKELVQGYKSKAVLLEPAGGCGAFIEAFQDWDYRVADIDKRALEYLRSCFDSERVFCLGGCLNGVCECIVVE